MVDVSRNRDGTTRLRFCWVLGALWLPVFLGSAIATGSATGLLLNAAQMIMLIVIVVVHASLLYGWSGSAFFCALSIVDL